MAGRQHAHGGGPEPTSAPPCQAFPFEFSTNVDANTTRDNPVVTERDVMYDGWITQLVVGWPDGSNNLVGVKFRRGSGERLFPRNSEDEFIGQNNFQHAYDLCARVEEEETLVAEFVNNDSKEHFVNVIPTIQERYDGA